MWGVSLNNAIDVLGPTDKLDKPPLEEVIVISWNMAIPLTLFKLGWIIFCGGKSEHYHCVP